MSCKKTRQLVLSHKVLSNLRIPHLLSDPEVEMAREEVDNDDGGEEGDEVGRLDPGGGGGVGAGAGLGSRRGGRSGGGGKVSIRVVGEEERVVLAADRHSESARRRKIIPRMLFKRNE